MSGKPAARVTDPTACPVPGHGVNPIVDGSPNVLFDGLPAARQGDTSACGGAIVSAIASTVLINGQPAATLGSVGAHGNVIIGGSGTILIGDSHNPASFTAPLPLSLPIAPDWIGFRLPGQGSYLGLACTAYFDDGSSQSGAFDGSNQVRLKTTGKNCQRLDLHTQDESGEPSVTDSLLKKILG